MVLFAIAQIPCYYRPLFFFGRLAILFALLSLLIFDIAPSVTCRIPYPSGKRKRLPDADKSRPDPYSTAC
jgi:hypothetical protein